MTAQQYIQSKLDDLKQPIGFTKPSSKEELIEQICKILTSKKFRKYSAKSELLDHIKHAVTLNVEAGQAINVTFVHGSYKLWRFEEAPEADWAELFALMYYTNWLRGICEIYEPGVWFDAFVDDLIVPKIDNISLEEVQTYHKTYQSIMDFLTAYQPKNFKMTITTVGDQYESSESFDKQLAEDVSKHAASLPNGLPVLSDETKAMIKLNTRTSEEQTRDSNWREKIALIHDAYLMYTKAKPGYHNKPTKIKAFTQPLSSGMTISVGTTKDSVAKFWVGVGALSLRGDAYRQVILSPNQLEKSRFVWEDCEIKGLVGKNFHKIRITS